MDKIEKYRFLLLMKKQLSCNLQIFYGSSYGLKEHKKMFKGEDMFLSTALLKLFGVKN